jgi:hypothetical protein
METKGLNLRRMRGRIGEHVTAQRRGKVKGNREPPIKEQSSGPNEVTEDAKEGAQRLTAPVRP